MTPGDRLLLAALGGVAGLLRRLGPVRASNLGGAVARTIGPALPVSRVAHANLAAALPALDSAGRARIVREVWDNLGRTVAEMPSLDLLAPATDGPGWQLIRQPGAEPADLAGGALYFGGHFANWDLMLALARGVHPDFAVFYRAPANAAVDQFVRGLRSRIGGPALQQFRKGAAGARQAVQHLRGGHVLALLADQKTNDGIAVPFFGRPAMTATAIAALAMKFRLPLIPTHAIRLGPARFQVTLESPLKLPRTADRHADIAALTQTVTACIERWAREHPGDWLWLHRRWPKPPPAR